MESYGLEKQPFGSAGFVLGEPTSPPLRFNESLHSIDNTASYVFGGVGLMIILAMGYRRRAMGLVPWVWARGLP